MPVIKSEQIPVLRSAGRAGGSTVARRHVLLAQNVKCLDGSSVSSFDECKPTQDDSNGEAME